MNSRILSAFVAVVYAFMLAPVVIVVLMSFFDQEIISFPIEGLTLNWYERALENRDFFRGLQTSLKVSLIATAIGVPLGVAAGLALIRGRLPGSQAISLVLLGPLVVPGIIAGAATYLFLVRIGETIDMRVSGSMIGLIAAHVLLTIPWSVRLTLASLEGQDERSEEAAANLGAPPLTVFFRVTLPKLRPAIVAATLFSFIQSFENLEMTLFLVGPGATTLPVAMLNYLEFRMDPTVAAMATLQILLVTAALLITDRFVNLASVVR